MPRVVKWRMPTADEAKRLGLGEDEHKDLAAAAVAKIDDPKHPLNGKAEDVAKAAGLTVAQARARKPKATG